MEDNKTPILSRDGEQDFNRYANALKTYIEPHFILLIREWNGAEEQEGIEPIAGKLTGEYVHHLMSGIGVSKLRAAIYSRSIKESPFNRAAFKTYYEGIVSKIEGIVSKIRQGINTHLKYLSSRVPANLKGIELNEGGTISQSYFDSIRPLFDDVLEDVEDIEFYHILHETATQLEALISGCKKRGITVIGSSYASFFLHTNEGKVIPQTDNLKLILSARKNG